MEEDLKDKKEIPVLVREWDQPKLSNFNPIFKEHQISS